METEVAPLVLAVINEGRLSGPRLNSVDIIIKMGVFDAREKAYEYAWLASGDNVIAAIWAEHVSVSADGHWFCLESLDTQTRPGGGTRTANQAQRSTDRIALLKRAFKEEKPFRAVLQTNRVSIAELESNRNSKIATRVRDAEEWHVAAWDLDQQVAVLVRGPRGWTPSEADMPAARLRCGLPAVLPPAAESAQQATPQALQSAAADYVTRHFKGYGYKPEVVSAQNLGYDIEVSNAKGAILLRVAVKGVAAKAPHFQLTPEERACSVRDPLWKLLIVTDPLGAAQHKIYKPTEVEQADGYAP